MKVGRALALVAVLTSIPLQQAMAQFGGMPGLPGSPMSPGFGAPAPAQPPAVCNELLAMRDQTQKHASAIGAANERKASPQEACALFRTFLASETKMIKRVEEQGARWPPKSPKRSARPPPIRHGRPARPSATCSGPRPCLKTSPKAAAAPSTP